MNVLNTHTHAHKYTPQKAKLEESTMHVWSSPIVVSSNNNKADVMCRYL